MERKRKFIINVAYYALILIIAWLALKYLISPMSPFIVAFLVAAVLQIPVRKLAKNEKQKKWLSLLFCTIFYVLVYALILWVVVKAMGGIETLIRRLPYLYKKNVVPIFNSISDQIEVTMANSDPSTVQTVEDYFQQMVDGLGSSVSSFSVKIVQVLSGGITSIPGLIVKAVITTVASFFFSGDYDRIQSFFKGLMTPAQIEFVHKGKDYLKNVLWIYLRSYTLLFTMTFAELAIGLTILGIPWSGLVALGIAVFDILPVLGTGGILLPWAAILFFMRNHGLAFGILILYLIITVVRNMAEPRIVGKQIGLHPLATLAALFLGYKLLGLIGLIGFPVTLAVVFSAKRENIFSGFKKRWYEEE